VVKLRLRRIGKKKHPVYKIVATDARAPRAGAYLEAIGHYDPNVNPIRLQVKEERVFYWLKKGAQPSDTVRSLLRRNGMWLRWTLQKRGTDEAKTQALLERWQMAQQEKAQREADRKARRLERQKQKKQEAAPEAPAAPAPEAQA